MTSLAPDSIYAVADPALLGDPASAVGEEGARPRDWRWWLPRGLAVTLLLFFLLIGWLAITAPLSKSLQPISPPEITLLAANGTPIARKGAIVEAPVKLSELPPHVADAFIAIEDRRFRSHWGIENRLHWVLDVTFHEDLCRVREGHGPENLAILRHFALNLLRQDRSVRGGVSTKRLRAALNDSYLRSLLSRLSA